MPARAFEGVSFLVATNGARQTKTEVAVRSIQETAKGSSKRHEIIICGNVDPFAGLEGVRLVESKKAAEQGMLAQLRNAAAERAEEDVLVFLDDDILFSRGWLSRLETYTEENGWDVLGNRILLPDGGRYWDRASMGPHGLVDYDHPEDDQCLYQTGCFWVVRRDLFEQHKWNGSIEYYAEKQGQLNEDLELSVRLHQAGIILRFDKENWVWHWDDSYTEWCFGDGRSVCARKDDITETLGIDTFLPNATEFVALIEALAR